MCGAALLASLSVANPGQFEQLEFSKPSLQKVPWEVLALLFLCNLIGSVVETLLQNSIPQSMTSINYYWPLISILVLIVVSVWTRRLGQERVYGLWPFFTFLLFSGILCFVTFYFVDIQVSTEFLAAVQEHLNCFIWLCLTSIVHVYRLPRMAAFGIGAIFLIQGEHFLASAFGFALPLVGIANDAAVTIILAAALGAILVFASLFVFSKNILKLLRENLQIHATYDADRTHDTMLSAISDRYKLSAREQEIASYLLRGYAFQKIADALFISIDTVRYHVKKLYKKLGVHNRQDFIKASEKAASDHIS